MTQPVMHCCAWCGAAIGEGSHAMEEEGSHLICLECARTVLMVDAGKANAANPVDALSTEQVNELCVQLDRYGPD